MLVNTYNIIETVAHTLYQEILIGQRGGLPVTPLGYLKFKKVIFRTMQTMQKQFPVNWLTSGRFSAPIMALALAYTQFVDGRLGLSRF